MAEPHTPPPSDSSGVAFSSPSVVRVNSAGGTQSDGRTDSGGEERPLLLQGLAKETPEAPRTRFSPVLMLVFITLCQLVNFFDRGVIAGTRRRGVRCTQRLNAKKGVLGPVGDALDLGDLEKGLLGTGFMLGYMIFAPVSGYLTAYIRSTRIMAVGLGIWVVAAGEQGGWDTASGMWLVGHSRACAIACASISRHFYPLLFSRVLLGFGEATFGGIAPAIIDDVWCVGLWAIEERWRGSLSCKLASPALALALCVLYGDARWPR